jgi:hypothetical protein
MTWCLVSAVFDSTVPVLHTYDINCQFKNGYWKRVDSLPDFLKEGLKVPRHEWQHLIPKMHLMGHIRKCQAPFSLNFARGAARTCGESIERMWALLNGISTSVREMGPGMRLDYIDFHMAYNNWRKHIRTGQFALTKLRILLTLLKPILWLAAVWKLCPWPRTSTLSTTYSTTLSWLGMLLYMPSGRMSTRSGWAGTSRASAPSKQKMHLNVSLFGVLCVCRYPALTFASDITSVEMKKLLAVEAGRDKAARAEARRKNHLDASQVDDCDDPVDEDMARESALGWVLQALRIEAGQYVTHSPTRLRY